MENVVKTKSQAYANDGRVCTETRTKKAFLITFIGFMLVGIAAMLMGMYFAPIYLEAIAAIFDVLRYGRKSRYYKESCKGADKSAPVCAIVAVSESIVGIVDNVEELSDNFVDASGNLVDASGNLVDASGNVVDASGNLVDATGNLDDATGNLDDATDNAGFAS